jgi:hypothetical protein
MSRPVRTYPAVPWGEISLNPTFLPNATSDRHSMFRVVWQCRTSRAGRAYRHIGPTSVAVRRSAKTVIHPLSHDWTR